MNLIKWLIKPNFGGGAQTRPVPSIRDCESQPENSQDYSALHSNVLSKINLGCMTLFFTVHSAVFPDHSTTKFCYDVPTVPCAVGEVRQQLRGLQVRPYRRRMGTLMLQCYGLFANLLRQPCSGQKSIPT